jgi:ZIP family zinc transporter
MHCVRTTPGVQVEVLLQAAGTGLWLYLALPVVASVAGGLLSASFALGPYARSGIQHFTAGVIFAAVAGELLPALGITHQPRPILLGFAIGVVTMLGIRTLTDGNTVASEDRGIGAMLAAVGIDALVDGMLVGIAFAAGEATGLLFVGALSLEMFFLALATGATMQERGIPRFQIVALAAVMGAILAASAFIMTILIGQLSGDAVIVVGGFGAAALLYLVTEELLVEAHETAETPFLTSLFFIGFIAVYLLEIR